MRFIALVSLLVGSACSSESGHCKADVDCQDPAYPYCDTEGEVGPAKDLCTVQPADCPVERCGCVGGAITCTNNTLVACSADGHSASTTQCSVGCEETGDACKTFLAPNGMDEPLAAAAAEPDVELPPDAEIDTDTGMVTGAGGSVSITTAVVVQGATSIRVFLGRSFAIHGVHVTGSSALAFVAPGAITVDGVVDASANGTASSVAAILPSRPSIGFGTHSAGAGGGNATIGAKSGSLCNPTTGCIPRLGGPRQTVFEPLVGGQSGGYVDLTSIGGPVLAIGGGGGGAIELVSLSTIEVAASALIDLGGGGGGDGVNPSDGVHYAGGGGAGGNLVLAAPSVGIDGVVVANGGGGGGCATAAPDGRRDGDPVAPIHCANGDSGAGGTGAVAPTAGATNLGGAGGEISGGGGAAGRVLVMNLDGMFAPGPAALISAKLVVEPFPVK